MTEDEMLAVKNRAQEWLFRIPGVTGVGFARKRVSGEFTATFAIIVYVEKKRPADTMPAEERIPAEIDGIPTDVVESPAIVVRGGASDEAEYPVMRGGIRIKGGVGGTAGFIARTQIGYKRGPGLDVLVSNQHVIKGFTQSIAPTSAHSIGQPDCSRCCESCDFCAGRIIGHQRADCVLNGEVDGGIVELKPGTQWRPEVQDSPNPVPITGVRTIVTTDTPLPVWKRGATTQRTAGNAIDVNFSHNANLPGPKHHRFVSSSIRIEGPAPFCDDGDSGAPLLDASNQLVGLVYGGGGTLGAACHIAPVLAQLFVEARTTANTPAAVQTVPVVPRPVLNDRNLRAPPLPSGAPAGPGVFVVLRDPRSFYDEVSRTDAGHEFLRLLAQHRDEILRLAQIKQVIVAWRRYGAADVASAVDAGLAEQQVLVPAAHRGRAAEECARAFARIVKRYCGERLARDLDRYVPEAVRLSGKTVREFIDALSTSQAGAAGAGR